MRIHRVIPAEDSACGSCVGKRPGAGSSQGAEGDPACDEGCGDDQGDQVGETFGRWSIGLGGQGKSLRAGTRGRKSSETMSGLWLNKL